MLITYIKNDVDLKTDNKTVLPIIWAFGKLEDPEYGYTAAAYVANFLSGLIVIAPEIAFVILYFIGETEGYGWYSDTVGYWGSIFLLPLAPFFATLQLILPFGYGGLGGDGLQEFGSNAIYIMSLGYPVWFSSMFIHVLFSHRLLCHTIANPPDRTPPAPTCPLDKKNFDTPEEYEEACSVVLADLKEQGKEAKGSGSANVDSEEAEGNAW